MDKIYLNDFQIKVFLLKWKKFLNNKNVTKIAEIKLDEVQDSKFYLILSDDTLYHLSFPVNNEKFAEFIVAPSFYDI